MALTLLEAGGNKFNFRAEVKENSGEAFRARIQAPSLPPTPTTPPPLPPLPNPPAARTPQLTDRASVTMVPATELRETTAPPIDEPRTLITMPPPTVPLPTKPLEALAPPRVEKNAPLNMPQPLPLPATTAPAPQATDIKPVETAEPALRESPPLPAPSLPTLTPSTTATEVKPLSPEPIKPVTATPEPLKQALPEPSRASELPRLPPSAATAQPASQLPAASPSQITTTAPSPTSTSAAGSNAASAASAPSSSGGAAPAAPRGASVTLPSPRASDTPASASSGGATSRAADGVLRPGMIDGFDPNAARAAAARAAARDLNSRKPLVPGSVAPSLSEREKFERSVDDAFLPPCPQSLEWMNPTPVPQAPKPTRRDDEPVEPKNCRPLRK